MKKIFLLIILSTIFLLTSCTNSKNKNINLENLTHDVTYIRTNTKNLKLIEKKKLQNGYHLKSEKYTNLSELSNDLEISFINSTYFSNQEYCAKYFQDGVLSQIVVFPSNMEFNSLSNIFDFKVSDPPFLSIEWVNNPIQKGIPKELMGNFSIEEEYKIANITVYIIKSGSEEAPIYLGAFKFDNKAYTINNVKSIAELKNIIDSFEF